MGYRGLALGLAVVAGWAAIGATAGVEVRIESPRPGASVPAGERLVTGRLASLPDAGVVVNGHPGFLEDTALAAMVPVTPEVTALVATATRPDGTTVRVRQPLRVTRAAARST